MKKYTIKTELTLTQVLQLRGLTGSMSSLTEMFDDTTSVLIKEGIDDNISTSTYIQSGWFNHTKYQDACERIVKESRRATVTVGGKKYYEDELTTALANIKEVR
jgi:hypothetical protein